ncbi:MAG: N-acetylmuramoyl-L-alanine amidase [Bryobacterales bacterium]|nr:N-acetylmuramoyl-L-alanine amidase [Bryobacterales bacterium]MBV9397418.1 N-acetylmuramoyl-L-alanine amidase [Bryobacterales bacterium]
MNGPEIKWIGCAPKNFRQGRPAGEEISTVVIHIIDGSQIGADATFLNNELAAARSAHYSVGRDGTVHQYVKESDTAYHAGVIANPTWTGMKKTPSGDFVNPNFYSIGIEHEGHPEDDWTDAMYASSAWLLRSISARYPSLKNLTRDNVIMHRQIDGDKSCPGFKVDLDRLIAEASATNGISM